MCSMRSRSCVQTLADSPNMVSVGDAYCLLVVVEGQGGQHWSEDLLRGKASLRVDVGDHDGWGEEPPVGQGGLNRDDVASAPSDRAMSM